jgi:hypothetical protein
MPEQRDHIKEAYDALDNDEAQMEFLFKRMEAARTNLGNDVERQSIDRDTNAFLQNLTDDVRQEWIDTKDYKALKRKILGYDADIPWWDEKHLLKVPKENFRKLGNFLATRMKEKNLKKKFSSLSKSEQSDFFNSALKDQMENKDQKDQAVALFLKLFLKVGPIDSAQFIEWLYSTQNGENFLSSPAKNLEDYFIDELANRHHGNYTIPEGTKDKTWFY